MTNLFQAARSGNIAILQSAASRGIPLDCTTADKWTLLHFAVLGSQSEVARFLLTRRVFINARTSTGATALHFAAQMADPSLAALLIEHGASLAAADANGQTPLHYAIAVNSLFLTQLLLDFKADPNTLDSQGFGPLHLAVDLGSRDIATMLMAAGANPTLFLSKEAFWTPIHLAAKRGYADVLEALLQRNPDVNAFERESALHSAAMVNPTVVSLLVSKGASVSAPDHQGEPSIFRAIKSRVIDNVKLLCNDKSIAARNRLGESPLHCASALGFSEIVEFLLKEQADLVRAIDFAGNTPLHFAVLEKRKETTQLLLEAGADVLARNRAGESVLALATGDVRNAILKFVAAHPSDCHPLPIERRKLPPPRVRPPEEESPGRAVSRTSDRTGSGLNVDVGTEDAAGMELRISQAIDETRSSMWEKVQELRKLLEQLKEDAVL
jgi:ankyrin repeat protein